MICSSPHQLGRKLGLITLLLFCLLLILVTGCAQKTGWKPPEEPKAAVPPPPPPPPKVDYQLLYVAVDRLNLRACPGMDCPKLVLLTRNQEVEKVGESHGWFQVRSRQDGSLGWVDGRYLASAPVSENVSAPAETAPPKPTKPVEAKPKVKTPAPVAEEEAEETPRPKRRRPSAAEAAEPPEAPVAEPVQEKPVTPPPAQPSDTGKKKIRIM